MKYLILLLLKAKNIDMVEAYCSLEVAKLLKEKNFDGESIMYFLPKDGANLYMAPTFIGYDDLVDKSIIICPTHQAVITWLRSKDIFIIVSPICQSYRFHYSYVIKDYNSKRQCEPLGDFPTYEKAVEDALKYALIKLI